MDGSGEVSARAIETQKRYYDLRAPDYMSGPPDRGNGVPAWGVSARESRAIVDELSPAGAVLELACGAGWFTRELARHAETVTAVDTSPQMLARNQREIAAANVRYVEADVFTWEPNTTYDVVFFGFFLSHVPPGAFDRFWERVRGLVRPGGRVAFVDEDDRARDRDDVRVVDGVPMARRTLADGRQFDIVKVFWNAEELAARLRALRWDIDVRRVNDAVFAGVGVDAGA